MATHKLGIRFTSNKLTNLIFSYNLDIMEGPPVKLPDRVRYLIVECPESEFPENINAYSFKSLPKIRCPLLFLLCTGADCRKSIWQNKNPRVSR